MAVSPTAHPHQPAGRDVTGSHLSIRVPGCDGSWTGPGGAGSGYLVASGGTSVLVDAGPGTFANLQRWIDPAVIDAVIISHHHPDHWTDLYALATHARFALDRRGIPVYAPAEAGRTGRAWPTHRHSTGGW